MKREFYRGSGRVKRRIAFVLAILIAFVSTMADAGYAYAVGLSFSEDSFEEEEKTDSQDEFFSLKEDILVSEDALETPDGEVESSAVALFSQGGATTLGVDNPEGVSDNDVSDNNGGGQGGSSGGFMERTVWFEKVSVGGTTVVPYGTSTFQNPLKGTNGAVHYTSNNPNVSVDDNGTVTLINRSDNSCVEEAVIEVKADGDGFIYKDTTVSYTVVFQGKAVVTIGSVQDVSLGDLIDLPEVNVVCGSSDARVQYYVSSGHHNYAWVQGDKIKISDYFDKASVNSAEVTVEAMVFASSDGRYVESDRASTTFTVYKVEQEAPAYTRECNLYVGQKKKYPVSFMQGANGAVNYTSDNPAVAKVDAKSGEVKAIAPGTANITVTKATDTRYKEASSTITVKVLENVESGNTYEIEGTKNNVPDKNGNYWYRGPVFLFPSFGYWISFDKNSFEAGNITIPEEGADEVSFYAYDVDNDAKTDEFKTETIYRDATEPDIVITQPKESHLYNKTAQFEVEANDTLSGLYSLSYTAKLDNTQVASGDISMGDAEESFTGLFDSLADGDGRYEINFTVTDYAGNKTEKNIAYKINTVLPEISVSMNDEGLVRSNPDGLGYYAQERTALITVICDSECFNGEQAKKELVFDAVSIKKKNGEANPVNTIVCSNWTHTPGETAREDKHEMTVTFKGEGIYDWAPSYTDEAGNFTNVVNYGSSYDATNFVLDNSKPTGTVSAVGKATWSSLVENVKYETFLNSTAKIASTGADDYSEIYKIDYYVQHENRALTEAELNDISANEWKSLDGDAAPKKDHYILYARIEDYAGNLGYVSTDGLLYDDTAPTVGLGGIDGNVHNSDVNVSIGASDSNTHGISSGLASVTYSVSNGVTTTGGGVLYTAPEGTIPLDAIVNSASSGVTVGAAANNTNDTSISVTVTDRAGNSTTVVGNMKFDVVKPGISVSYDNNSGNTAYGTKAYFKAGRTAKIEITERNFTEGGVSIVAKNNDGAAPVISGWSSYGSGDSTVNVATVSFAADGDYEFSVACTDAAGNVADGVNFGKSLSPSAFVVDKTKPVVNVTYDNNNYTNDNFYDLERTATIHVTERNYSADKIVFTSSAVDNGIVKPSPALSAARTSGDVHTMSVPFGSDAHYNWSFAFTDMAGNEADLHFSDDFYVDTTLPSVNLTGVMDKSVYDSPEIGFNLTVTDTNTDLISVKLESVVRDGKSFVKKEVDIKTEDVRNGKRFTIDNLPEDGVYTLYLEAIDKAGNSYNSVKYDNDGKEPVSVAAEEQSDVITSFTVNREGSVFWMDDESLEAVGSYYVQGLSSDLVIYEVNADRLSSHELMINGNPIKEGKDYSVTEEHSDNSWYKYSYTIDGSFFEKEGEYNVVASSVDKKSRTAYSDVKDLEISFDIDKTAPTMTLAGLENNGRYKTSAQTVTVMPLDDGGKVGRLSVKVNNNDGETIATPFSMEGEELSSYLEANAGTVEFAIPEGVKLSVDIECEDMAKYPSNAANKTVYSFENITVSENAMVIFWAGAKNLIIAVGAFAVVGAGATVGILKLRKIK